jgi:hypothetical protein
MVMLITTVKRHLVGLPILLIVLFGPACAPDHTAELDDVREATFRYQFRTNASGLQQRARVFFLALRDTKSRQRFDPTEDFLRRFKDHHPRVGPVSAARSSSTDGVIDKTTGERGLIFIVGEIHWLAADRVDVKGGYFEAGESSSGNTYHLRKKDGKWEVESDTMHWISRLAHRRHPAG